MKVKLTVKDPFKFRIACEATDVNILEEKKYGQTSVMVVNIKHASQLYEAGLIQPTLILEQDLPKELAQNPEKEQEHKPVKKYVR